MIILEPQGGLANRIRVIANGIWLKKQLNTLLYVIWNDSPELNCPIHLLFEPVNEFTIISKSSALRHVAPADQGGVINRLKAKLWNRVAGISYCITDANVMQTDVLAVARSAKNIYIRTCQRFTGSLDEMKLFIPIRPLQQRINDLKTQFGPNCIGVQVRRTDNKLSIQNSPLHLFIVRMQQLLSANEQTRFYLSTDEPGVANELTAVFGETIIFDRKELNRQTTAGIQGAVVDMYTLSATKLILASYWSSFAEVASWIADSPIEVMTTI